MRLSNSLQYNETPFEAPVPELKFGTTAPDTSEFFTTLPVGSRYWLKRQTGTTYGVFEEWVKVFDQNLASDWRCVNGVLSERISVADFTDGGAAVGTLVLTADLPAGAFVLGSQVNGVVGFAGDTTAVLTIGDGTDADRYNTGTYNVFATATWGADAFTENPPSGNRGHTAAMTTITITVTSSADFTAVKNNGAGRATVSIFYVL